MVEPTIVGVFGLIFTLTLAQVVFRYLFNSPIMWAEELVRYAFVWGVMLAASSMFASGGHIAIESFTMKLPPMLLAFFQRLTWVIIGAFSLFLAVYGTFLIMRAGGSKTPALGIPIGYAYAAVPVGALIWALICIDQLVRSFLPHSENRESTTEEY